MDSRDSQTRQVGRRDRAAGFTLPELLAVIGVIVVLLAVLLPALSSVTRTGLMTKSQNRLRQIATWMRLYSSENREFVVPSQFNYTDPADPSKPAGGYPIKVRSSANLGPLRYKGTWTDVLWTYNDLGQSHNAGVPDVAAYRFDSPDAEVYKFDSTYDQNPFRAAAANSREFFVAANAAGNGPKPFGTGAAEAGLPGYFAANNFFNADRDAPLYPGQPAATSIGRWYVTSQILKPDRSMYLVDSVAGETIDPVDAPYNDDLTISPWTIEVDFRYNGTCLMLLLDGHTSNESAWANLAELQGTSRRVRIQRLDMR